MRRRRKSLGCPLGILLPASAAWAGCMRGFAALPSAVLRSHQTLAGTGPSRPRHCKLSWKLSRDAVQGANLVRHLWRLPLPPRTIALGKLLALLLLQKHVVHVMWRQFRRSWRRFFSKAIQIDSAEDLCALEEALLAGPKLKQEVKLGSGGIMLDAGSEVLTPLADLEDACKNLQLPVFVRVRPARAASHFWQVWELGLSILSRGVSPLLFWGWCDLGISVAWSSVSRWCTGKQLVFFRAALSKLSLVSLWTAFAWFAHRLIGFWAQRQSRGRAETGDVLGITSSLREAQVNALKTLLQVLVWVTYTTLVLWWAGIRVDRLLLIPGTTALVIGWVGREVVANIISGFVLHLTQPFAQGDWVSLESSSNIDGWVQDIGTFYTKIVQWDKRPMYVPNFKLMSMNVQNNSRMTHRRILYDLKLRIRDIPKIPSIVRDMQDMLYEHEDVDNVQHRLVRWRDIGDYAATIWVSCYTKPDMEGIRLATYTATQQSLLERLSAIVYKYDAAFASITDRSQYGYGEERKGNNSLSDIFSGKFYDAIAGNRESQLASREDVIQQRERDLKLRERELEAAATVQSEREQQVKQAKEKYQKLLEQAVVRKAESRQGGTSESPKKEQLLEGSQPPIAAASEGSGPEELYGRPSPAESSLASDSSTTASHSDPAETRSRDLADVLEAADAELAAAKESVITPATEKEEQIGRKDAKDAVAQDVDHTEASVMLADEVAADDVARLPDSEEEEGHRPQQQQSGDGDAHPDTTSIAEALRAEEVARDDKGGQDLKKAEMSRIPVKEMGD